MYVKKIHKFLPCSKKRCTQKKIGSFFCVTVYNKSVYMWVSRLVCGDLLDSSAGLLFVAFCLRNE